MVKHGWFSYWDNPCHNATFDHGWLWLMIVDHDWYYKPNRIINPSDWYYKPKRIINLRD